MENKIPHPPRKPIIGNLHQIAGKTPMQNMLGLALENGPIFEMKLLKRKLIVTSGFEIVNEITDEKRFHKNVVGALEKLRVFIGDGLFTAQTKESNWLKAHNILMHGFGMNSMKEYYPMMTEVAWELIKKWEKNSAEKTVLNVPDDMTKLTLDTIGLCGFDYRFNSFEKEEMHPFINSMNGCLEETLLSLYQIPLINKLRFRKRIKFNKDIELMNKIVDGVIAERKASQKQNSISDFLGLMLNGVDKASGKSLDDKNIRYQIITFLIAGHETTSGLISFTISYLLDNPDVLQKAYDEIDEVLGNDLNKPVEYKNITELKYLTQILKETLRLWSPAPGFIVSPFEDTVIGNKYSIKKGEQLLVLIPALHRQKEIWGNNPEKFNPDNFSKEAEQARPDNAYKPFGNGQRACIGRQFAMVEATLILAMILQRFKFINHTNYKLKIKETLTLKPEDFKIKIAKRTDSDRKKSKLVASEKKHNETATSIGTIHDTPLLILFGSNMGTSESIAQQLNIEAKNLGFKSQISSLDNHGLNLPDSGAVIFVSSTYNGTPPDNAVKFIESLNAVTEKSKFKNVKYTVLGCGNSDWKTFQVVPRLIDKKLSDLGAKRIHETGEADANGDFESMYEKWHSGLWPALINEFKLSNNLESKTITDNIFDVKFYEGETLQTNKEPNFGTDTLVLKNYELQNISLSKRSTRHLEFKLPKGAKYQAGDHLGVFPKNSTDLLNRVARRFNLNLNSVLEITQSNNQATHLPLNEKITLNNLLQNYVELQDTASRKQLKQILAYTVCPPEKKRLENLINDDANGYIKYVLEGKRSLLDLLEEFPASETSFTIFLEMMAPLKPRYYSISSSPLNLFDSCSITVSVLDVPARSGKGNHKGVCSNFLFDLSPDQIVRTQIKDSGYLFRLPKKAETPIIMIGPGTGYAPFRGFLQEREAQMLAGIKLGKSILFFGSRSSASDFIYKEELMDLEKKNITNLITAFSRENDNEKVYVQNKIYEHKDEVWEMMNDGGIIYICGDAGKMEPDVRVTLNKIHSEKSEKSLNPSETWTDKLVKENRYVTDVWASS